MITPSLEGFLEGEEKRYLLERRGKGKGIHGRVSGGLPGGGGRLASESAWLPASLSSAASLELLLVASSLSSEETAEEASASLVCMSS